MLTIREQIFDQINKADNCLIVLSKNPSGDALAGALALFLYLKKAGKKADLLAENPEHAKDLSFLSAFNEIKTEEKNFRKFIISLSTQKAEAEQIKYSKTDRSIDFIVIPKSGIFTEKDVSAKAGGYKYNLIIAVGLPDLESIGKFYQDNLDFFYQTPLINIDNDPGNEEFGQINYLEIVASSVSEMIFSLLKEKDISSVDEDIATCLLAGLIIGTKRFKVPNVTPQALEAAAQLIGLDARMEEINNALYRSIPLTTLKLWGRALARLASAKNDSLVWSTLNYNDFIKTGSEKSELPQIINELFVNIPQAKIGAIFYEEPPGQTHRTAAIIQSIKIIELENILQEFNPAPGNGRRITIKSRLPLNELSEKVIKILTEQLDKIDS